VENRRRRLEAWSRHAATPRRVLVELSADGTDYAVVADAAHEPADGVERALMDVLRAAPGLTAREAYDRWPADGPRLRRATVGRRLAALCDAGRLTRTGGGHRYDPYRYWLADDEGTDDPAIRPPTDNGSCPDVAGTHRVPSAAAGTRCVPAT